MSEQNFHISLNFVGKLVSLDFWSTAQPYLALWSPEFYSLELTFQPSILRFVNYNDKSGLASDKPSEFVLKKAFSTFGEVRIVDIPMLDPYRYTGLC